MTNRTTPVGTVDEELANSHPKLRRGQVWCRTCRRTENVNSADALRHGWPKCCGYTMTIDPPEEWNTRARSGEHQLPRDSDR